MKVLIIDDEPLARTIVRDYLKSFPDVEIVGECGDGYEGLKAIGTLHPDLIFLDIQMPKINGFEMLELVDDPPAVIFTTAYDEYAIKAFDAHAVDYLLKPFSKERFGKALARWMGTPPPASVANALAETPKYPDEGNRIVVKKGNAIKIIPADDVHYVEAFDDYVKIFTAEGFHLKKKTMAYFESVLNPKEFVRVHRSYIINLKQLTRIEPMEKDSHVVILRSGTKVPVSKSGYTLLKQVLNM